MNELSQEALYNLTYTALDFTDTLFQVWLSITFAAILAIFFSGTAVTRWMRWLLIVLYTGSSVLLTGRWMIGIGHVRTYADLLDGAGYAPFPTPIIAGSVMGVLHLLMFVVGTLATIYFMSTFRGQSQASGSGNSG